MIRDLILRKLVTVYIILLTAAVWSPASGWAADSVETCAALEQRIASEGGGLSQSILESAASACIEATRLHPDSPT